MKRPPVLTGTTTQPPTRPPDDLCCPRCLQQLTYRHTTLGGVRATPEQWDSGRSKLVRMPDPLKSQRCSGAIVPEATGVALAERVSDGQSQVFGCSLGYLLGAT